MPDARPAPRWAAAWDALDDGLARLRACRDAAELADRACELALSSCGAERAALGRVRDGVFSPWRKAGARQDAVPLVPRVPTALEELPLELEVVRSGRIGVRPVPDPDRGGAAPGGGVVVVAGVRGGGQVVGLLHLGVPTPVEELIAQAYADGLASMFGLIGARERVRAQSRLLGTMGDDLEGLRQHDPIELVPVRGPETEAGRAAPPDVSAAALREGLTDRQREVLELLLAGESNAQIAERLFLAVPTVKSHVRAVLRAVGAVNRSEAVARFSRARPGDDGPRA